MLSKHGWAVGCSALALCWGLIGVARAEIEEGDIEIGGFVGGLLHEGGEDIGDGGLYGARIGYFFTEHCSLELSYGYSDANDEGTVQDGDIHLIQLDALYTFGDDDNRLQPFIAIGGGARNIDFTRRDTGWDGYFDYGVGLRYTINDRWSIRGDIRHIIAGGDPIQSVALTAGLSYAFGAREPEHEAMPSPTPMKVAEAPKPTPKPEPTPEPDSDGDGVPDSRDKCPDTPKGAKVDENGCWVLPGVLFDHDKATIKPMYASLLDDAAMVLKNNPDVEIEIHGHCSSPGTDAYNQKLSERRAAAVKKYLVDHGISDSRLFPKGFGESKPVATNDTPEGQAKNRRVELHVMP